MAKSKKKDELPLTIDVSGIMETKITRSEAIEMMLQESLEKVQRQCKELHKEKSSLGSITVAQLIELLDSVDDNSISVSFDHWYGNVNDTVNTAVRIPRKNCRTPQWFVERQERHKQIVLEERRLQEVEGALRDRGKAKLTIMKQVLEGNDEGRAFLKQVESMSVALNGRLLANAGVPKSPTTTTITRMSQIVTVEEE